MRRWNLAVAATSLIWLSCSDLGATPHENSGLGDPCLTAATECLDDERLRTCDNRVWVDRNCPQACEAAGMEAVGCGPDPTNDACLCSAQAPDECSSGARECAGMNSLRTCSTGQWEVSDCNDTCGELGLVSLGCTDLCEEVLQVPDTCFPDYGPRWDCLCSSEGHNCEEEGEAQCVAPSFALRCEAGTWSLTDCRSSCESDSARCDAATSSCDCD